MTDHCCWSRSPTSPTPEHWTVASLSPAERRVAHRRVPTQAGPSHGPHFLLGRALMKTLMCCLSLLLAGCSTTRDNPIERNNNAITASVGAERIEYGEAVGDTETGA